MNNPATLLNALIIAAHNGSPAAFCEKHAVKKQTVSSVINGKGNSRLSFVKLEEWAKADGYTIGTLLHPHTGGIIADAMAHVRAAAIEARHVLECQDELNEEQREQIALLDEIINSLNTQR